MNDKWARILGIPVLAVLMQFAHDGTTTFTSWPVMLSHYVVALAMTVSYWEGVRAILVRMRRLFPRNDQTLRRLLVQSLCSLAFVIVTTAFTDWLLRVGLGVLPRGGPWTNYLINLVPTVLVTSLYECVYFFSEWKQNLQRSEALARAALQRELEALQRQLDPHFLFNSLNTLSALIDDANAEAQEYVELLAEVYRYVLLSHDKSTVPLAEELAFVDAYVALNKTRFRDDLLVEQYIASDATQGSVAPLSVQMLIENALKHNVVSSQHPLRVILRAEGGAAGFVSVANNVHLKSSFPASTKIGLRNIINQYRLLTQQAVEVSDDAGFFIVRLPLLPAAT
jgi:hypothetical protein